MREGAVRRTSQFCRILGNPTAYRIVRLLDGNRRRPVELSRTLGVSPSAVVTHLKHLQLAGIVRSRSTARRRKGRQVEYWLANPRIARILLELERILETLRD